MTPMSNQLEIYLPIAQIFKVCRAWVSFDIIPLSFGVGTHHNDLVATTITRSLSIREFPTSHYDYPVSESPL